MISSTLMPRSRCRSDEQVEDLRLNRDVERGGGLVGDQELGLAGEGDGDHHALAHAARELVGVGVDALASGRDAHPPEQLDGARARLCTRHAAMGAHGLHDLSAHREHRVRARSSAPGRSSRCPARARRAACARRRWRAPGPRSEWSRSRCAAGGRGKSPRSLSAVTLLPEPLSPTSPTVLPRGTSNDTPSTARSSPASVRNDTTRSRTSSSGEPRVERAGPRVSTDISETILRKALKAPKTLLSLDGRNRSLRPYSQGSLRP